MGEGRGPPIASRLTAPGSGGRAASASERRRDPMTYPGLSPLSEAPRPCRSAAQKILEKFADPLWTRGSEAFGCRWPVLGWTYDGDGHTPAPGLGRGRADARRGGRGDRRERVVHGRQRDQGDAAGGHEAEGAGRRARIPG